MGIKFICSVIFCVLVFENVFATSDSVQPDLDLKMHFTALSTKRYPLFAEGKPWLEARKYVKERMRHYGARDLREQVFNTTVEGQAIQGVNLIGIAEGQNTQGNDSVILVGADYDTNKLSNQLKDNTGGVAIMLEIMHLFFDKDYWNQYFLNYTVIFVAFDINTREYKHSGMGEPGSYYFVHDWLLHYLDNKTHPKIFKGAIILDSITTYNVGNETQKLREGFEDAMPKAYEDITERGNKGDFLGFLYTSNEEKNPITKTFVQEYNKDRKLRPYRLQEMEIHLDRSLMGEEVLKTIDHQSHYYFWTNFDKTYLPSFLLFDTDDDREDPTGDVCDPLTCSVERFLTKERIDFLSHTTYTLFNTLLKLQTTYYEFPNGAEMVYSSRILFLTTFCIVLSFLVKRLSTY